MLASLRSDKCSVGCVVAQRTLAFQHLETFSKFPWQYYLGLIYEASICGIVPNPSSFLRNSNELSVLSRSMRRNAIFKARNSIQNLLKEHRGSSSRLDKRPCLASLGTRCWRLTIRKQSFLTSSLQLRNREADSEGGFVQGSTIYALSTAPGRAGIAIVRISGPSCLDVWISINQ